MTKEAKEIKTRKNPDYVKTILNQTNSDEVKSALHVFYQLNLDLESAREKLQCRTEYQEFIVLQEQIADQTKKIKETIDQYGSYMDVENGVYGLKHTMSKAEYHAQPMLDKFPKEANIAVEQMINVDALKGLIKGKILNQDELEAEGVITYKISERYLIQ